MIPAPAATGAPFEYTPDQNAALALLGSQARHVMLYGGARSGKTFVVCTGLAARALKADGSRHAIFRHRFNHLKVSIGLDTFPKMMKLRFPGVPYRIDKTDWVIRIRDSEIWLAGLDDKERTEKILGQEYATIFLNECSQISLSAALMARTRLAQNVGLINRMWYDCNPPGTRHWTALQFVSKLDPSAKPIGTPLTNPHNFAAMLMNPEGNLRNLPREFLEELNNLPKAQRDRFLLGKFTKELDNALWSVDGFRRVETPLLESFRRIVVAVDPSGASAAEDKRSDEIGIIVAGQYHDGRFCILADRTLRGSPEQWAAAVIKAFREFVADRIVAETNFGGDMVAATIRQVDRFAPVFKITASRGKAVRAEPISALYSQGRVDHVAGLGDLEDQMCNMTTSGYMGDRSPDRLDAAVWALTELARTVRLPSVSTI